MQHWVSLRSHHIDPFRNLQQNNYSVKHLFLFRVQVSFITLTRDLSLDFPSRYPLIQFLASTFPTITYLNFPFKYLSIHSLKLISLTLPCLLMPLWKTGSLQRVNRHVKQVAPEINPKLPLAIRMNFMFSSLRATSYREFEGCLLSSQLSTIILWKLLWSSIPLRIPVNASDTILNLSFTLIRSTVKLLVSLRTT